MSQGNKININIGEIEILLEGEEEFINKYSNTIDHLLGIIESGSKIEEHLAGPGNLEGIDKQQNGQKSTNSKEIVPGTFGELYQYTPNDISNTDKALLVAYFIQSKSEDNSFKTREVTKTLKKQGINLSNTSQCIKTLINQKKVFTLEKGKYRVGEPGNEYLKESLLG